MREITFLNRYKCQKCRKDYGQTNLAYEGIPIWVTCDCNEHKECMHFVNLESINFEDAEVVFEAKQ